MPIARSYGPHRAAIPIRARPATQHTSLFTNHQPRGRRSHREVGLLLPVPWRREQKHVWRGRSGDEAAVSGAISAHRTEVGAAPEMVLTWAKQVLDDGACAAGLRLYRSRCRRGRFPRRSVALSPLGRVRRPGHRHTSASRGFDSRACGCPWSSAAGAGVTVGGSAASRFGCGSADADLERSRLSESPGRATARPTRTSGLSPFVVDIAKGVVRTVSSKSFCVGAGAWLAFGGHGARS